MSDTQQNTGTLDLRDLAPDRRKVRFTDDGPLVEMATPNDLTIRQRVELSKAEQRRDELNEKTRGRQLSSGQRRRLEELQAKETTGTLSKGEKRNLEELQPPELTDDEAKELEALTNRSAEIVLFDMSPSDVAALPYFQREAVVLDFTLRFGTTIAKLAKAAGGPELTQALEALKEETTPAN